MGGANRSPTYSKMVRYDAESGLAKAAKKILFYVVGQRGTPGIAFSVEYMGIFLQVPVQCIILLYTVLPILE